VKLARRHEGCYFHPTHTTGETFTKIGRNLIREREYMSDISAPPKLLPFVPVERFDLPAEDLQRPIWEIFRELGSQIPEEEIAKLPSDGAERLDHYLYGATQQETG
jgi:hypothetical protein